MWWDRALLDDPEEDCFSISIQLLQSQRKLGPRELPERGRKEAIELAVQSTATMAWVPNPGPQTQAFLCEAGKTDLGIGLALTAHKRSLLLRRINKDAVKIKPRIEEILGHDTGYNGQLQRWRLGERQIDIAGCEQESDKQRFKGDPPEGSYQTDAADDLRPCEDQSERRAGGHDGCPTHRLPSCRHRMLPPCHIERANLRGRRESLSQANKLSRTHVLLVEALNRHRGKRQQEVTV